MSKRIPLTQGKFALVSDCDYEYLMQWEWFAVKDFENFYAARHRQKGKRRLLRMHQVIFGSCCDHKNRNGLDNRRCNLRKATANQQMANRRMPKNNTSGYKGVSWFKYRRRWQAKIGIDGKKIHLGYYRIKEEAAKAYDEAALRYHGEFAVLNFPEAV